MKRFLAILLLLVSAPLSAVEYIESFHSDIEIQRNGDLRVTETIVVKAEGKQIRRGIYRDFPTDYQDARGRRVVVGFEVLSITRDGVTEPYHIKRQSNGERIYIGDSNVYLKPGFYEYRISYLTTRQLGFFEDYDELYWNVTGNGWSFKIDEVSARVTLPDTVSDPKLAGYTGYQGAKGQDLTFRRIGNDQVHFESTRPLHSSEGLTIAVGWPKGLVDEPSAAQRRAWFFQDHRSAIVTLIGALGVFIYYLLCWRVLGKDPEAGVIVPLYRPPEGYSPASMRFVENMAYDKKCFTSAVINLAVKGALDINDDDGEFKLSRNSGPLDKLAAGEAQVLNGLFGDGRKQISIAQSNHRTLSRAIRKHKSSLKRDYEKNYFYTNRWVLLPGVVATLILLVNAVTGLGSEEVIAKTIFGGVFTIVPLLLFMAMWHGIRHGKKLRAVINLVSLIGFGAFFLLADFPFRDFAAGVSWPVVGGVIALLLTNYLFYEWLKAPTLAGRRLLDKIEGFKHYLQVAEEDEIAMQDAPKFTTDIYETYLPYAIALNLQNAWTARLDRAIASGLVNSGYSQPRWYRSRSHHHADFSSSLASDFDSAISSSSVAPGSSSGSSGGGSSGGGGGGGGGGGW